MKINRRKFIGGSVFVMASFFIAKNLRLSSGSSKESTEALIQKLQEMKSKKLSLDSSWTPAEVFHHLATAIDFQMSSYPTQKPKWFQKTIAYGILSLFFVANRMKHDLEEKIPGEPQFDKENVLAAIDRLIDSLRLFEAHTGDYSSHFFFGRLTKEELRLYNELHIKDHLKEFKVS